MKRRKYSYYRVKNRRSYSTSELADLFQIHIRTVQSWHKQGLASVDPNEKPLLFMGSEIRRFLSGKQCARRTNLKNDEFYCPRCRKARWSVPQEIKIVETGKRMGKTDEQVLIKGICHICECRLTRFSTKTRITGTFFDPKITQSHQGLICDAGPCVNADTVEECSNNGFRQE